jgi:hypothetical protein
MPNDEYREMIEFLGRKFGEVDTRLKRVATKEEVRAQHEESRRHFEVVAEGVVNIDGKLEEFRCGVEGEFIEVRSMIRFSYAELEQRIQALEQ